MNWKKHLEFDSRDLIFSRNDPNDLRIGETITQLTDQNSSRYDSNLNSFSGVLIWGFPDDEGIKINQGRPGARLGPNTIRSYLYKMPVLAELNLYELGNFKQYPHDFEKYKNGREVTDFGFNQSDCRILSFGGGHDYAYCDGSGFLSSFASKGQNANRSSIEPLTISHSKPTVINFDAHFDVRDPVLGLNSGTAFFRLIEEYKDQFDFFEVGIQPQCNSSFHRKWCEQKNVRVLDLQQCTSTRLKDLCFQIKSDSPVWLSLDIDVFSNAYAPGCSQSWGIGLDPKDFLNFMIDLCATHDVRGLSIYETSPPLDSNNITSKLAAQISYHYLICAQKILQRDRKQREDRSQEQANSNSPQRSAP